jgi:hypothetical protein
MKFSERVVQAVKVFRTQNNSMGSDLSRDFFRHGNNKPLVQDWSKVVMNDRDLYTGYPYAAINLRANKVAQLATANLKTDATTEIIDAARKKEDEVVHPYIDVINRSKSFSNYKFWYDISTFLDLEGVYYLFVLRNVGEAEEAGRVGNPLEFKLLNPYNIRRVLDKESYEQGIIKIGGYVESKEGFIRTFKPETIIEMRKLNPFSEEDPWAMTDAAKESQYTLKQAGDYTRHSLKNNMSAPGIISTDVLLDPQQFQNFVSRVTNQDKGVPLFGNGSGAITWDSMQIDMDKAALDKIHEIHRSTLMAVSGVGKTMSSIEESGTTRDTAKVQKDLFVENHVMPQLQLIIDALNQDYKVYYESQYNTNEYEIYIDNPLGSDRDAELKDIEIRDEGYKLYDTLVAAGYKRELASKYAEGRITLEELGDPTEEPRPNPVIEAAMLKAGQLPGEDTPPAEDNAKKKKPAPKAEESFHNHDHIPAIRNEFDEQEQGLIATQQASLQNAIQGIEARITNSVLDNVFKVNNQFEEESDVMKPGERNEYISELALALGAFYGIVMPLYGSSTMSARLKEFGVTGTFKMTSEVRNYIKEISKQAAKSHVGTVLEDLRKTVQAQYDLEVKRNADVLAGERAITDADLVLARKKALEGASRLNIVNAVKKEYATEISQNRAKAIARTETNRAFTQSQYFADLQFIKQNGFDGQAYKKWTTRSDNPCAICQSLASQGPIPFSQNFADLGDELTATYTDEKGKTRVLKQVVNFEELSAGNAHVNCSCRYVLIIQ